MKRSVHTISILSLALLTGGCMSPHGGPWCPPLEWMAAVDAKSRLSQPNVEGSGGTSPETALTIHTNRKEYLKSDEISWMMQQYLPLAEPRPSAEESQKIFLEFHQKAKHETRRIGRRVFDIVMVTLSNGETVTNYFDVTRQRFHWPREQ